MAKQNTSGDVEFIKALATLLDEKDLTEIQVKRNYGDDDSMNVRVSRTKQIVQTAVQVAAPASTTPAAPAVSPAEAPAGSGDDPASHPGAVNSPMVGTAYLSPEPDAPVFANVGDKVSEGDTLLILEAMKTMNHIPAPRSGTVKRVLVSDGDAVEFGAPLMIVE